MYATADLCDAHGDNVNIAEPVFAVFGQKTDFHGPIETIKTFEDNSLVRACLEEPGEGKVLVVDGGASMRCALLGDNLAQLAVDNNWAGLVIYGCIRDSGVIDGMDVGVRALNTHPRKSVKRNFGDRNLPVHFAGVVFTPGHYLYADADGIIVSPEALPEPA